MIVVVDKAREKAVSKFVAKYPNVVVITEDKFKADDDLKALVETQQKNVQIAKLTQDERKLFSKVSMDVFWRMARGEMQGYNLTPALDVIAAQVGSPESAVQALEILGALPGKDVQYRLMGIVTDPMREQLRLPAAMELTRHMQKNGVLLEKKQLDELRLLTKETAEGTPLRAQLNVAVTLFARASAPKTGADLFKFRPDQPAPPKEKKKDL